MVTLDAANMKLKAYVNWKILTLRLDYVKVHDVSKMKKIIEVACGDVQWIVS